MTILLYVPYGLLQDAFNPVNNLTRSRAIALSARSPSTMETAVIVVHDRLNYYVGSKG